MNWIRGDLFTPVSAEEKRNKETTMAGRSDPPTLVGDNSNEATPSHARCPLHKLIRNKEWPTVMIHIRKHPQYISHQNRVGWTSLILAIFHDAPIEIIATMLSSVTEKERQHLLSVPVPNGKRLCLHFAARFSNQLDIFRLLVEAYPLALAAPSTDGNRPLDRAVYYRKDASILRYLEETTKEQMIHYHNEKLRQVIIESCSNRWTAGLLDVADKDLKFVLEFYGYTKEREMFGLFLDVLSYVGTAKSTKVKETSI